MMVPYLNCLIPRTKHIRYNVGDNKERGKADHHLLEPEEHDRSGARHLIDVEVQTARVHDGLGSETEGLNARIRRPTI